MDQKIILSGFTGLDSDVRDRISKKVADFIGDSVKKDRKIIHVHVSLKVIHEREKSEKYELTGRVEEGKIVFAASVVDRNPLTAIDLLIAKLASQLAHKK